MTFSIEAIKSGKGSFDVESFVWIDIWQRIVNDCGDILTEEQKEDGYNNEGIKIEEKQAKVIADSLSYYGLWLNNLGKFIRKSGGFNIR